MQGTKKDYSAFRQKSSSTAKLSMLTAYDFNTACALEEAGIDTILVGDSLAMVALGYPDTSHVSFEEMLICAKAVLRGAPNTTVVVDVPLETIKKGTEAAVEDCKKFMEAGASMLKLEGAEDHTVEIIKELDKLNIPVFGHIGFTMQTAEKFINGRLVKDKEKLFKDAKILEELGVKGVVVEMVPEPIATELTKELSIPTIGIGAGPNCDGQILVTDDLLGRYSIFKPKFVRKYTNQFGDAVEAIKNYMNDIQETKFPAEEEYYK